VAPLLEVEMKLSKELFDLVGVVPLGELWEIEPEGIFYFRWLVIKYSIFEPKSNAQFTYSLPQSGISSQEVDEFNLVWAMKLP